MKKAAYHIVASDLKNPLYNLAMLFFRTALAVQLIAVHGLKKLGIGVENAEAIPNPLGFPSALNDGIAIAANVYLPVLLIFGFLTRLAALPALAVTLTGYFIVHAHDPLSVSDVPYMYSISLLLIVFLGSGRYSADYFLSQKIKRLA